MYFLGYREAFHSDLVKVATIVSKKNTTLKTLLDKLIPPLKTEIGAG